MNNHRDANQITNTSGLEMVRPKGGNDHARAAARLRLRWSFPPFGCQEGNWARIEIDLHWISNGSKTDHDLRLQRTIHEVHPMQFDIRATNTVTTRPSRPCITPGLQQDRSLCSTISRTAIPRTHSDCVEVGRWLSDISIASVCGQRFVLT
jgi:hypothetical protein